MEVKMTERRIASAREPSGEAAPSAALLSDLEALAPNFQGSWEASQNAPETWAK